MIGQTIVEILSHLFRHRARTLLTIAGLAVGIFALTIIGSLGETFNAVLAREEEAALGMIHVWPASWERQLTPTTRRAVRQVPGVAGTLTSLWADLADPAEEQETGFELIPESLTAVDSDIPGLEYGPPAIRAGLLQGRYPHRGATDEALLDYDLAKAHGWDLGDTMLIRGRPFTVVGILERPPLGGTRNAYVDYYTLRDMLHFEADYMPTLDVIPEPGQDPAELAARLEEQVPGVRAETPEQQMAEDRREFGILGAIAGVSAGLALLAGTLIIVNTMLMSVRERRHEIGLKKALGASDGDVVFEFLLEASTLGALGGGLGVLLASFLVLGVNQFTRARWGLALLTLTPRLAFGGVALTGLLGALAGAYPAWRAAREDPVRALRDAPILTFAERGLKRLLYLVGRRARWLLTVGGISVGILILTVALSLAEYLNYFTGSAVAATQDRVGLYPWRRPNMAYTTTLRELERLEGVRGVVVMAYGVRVFDADADMPRLLSETPYVNGLDSPTGEFGFNLPYRATIERGRLLTPGSLHEVVLGPRLAGATGLDVGDVLTIRDRDLVVVGIWDEPQVTFPSDYTVHAYVTMAALRRLTREELLYPELTALVAPGADAEEVAARIREAMPEWRVETSEGAAEEIRQAMLIFTLVLVGYVSLGLLVGGLSVMNTMVMAVMERTREIGLKKAVGASDGDLLAEIVEEAGWVGMLGGAVGLVVGWLLTIGFNTFSQRTFGFNLLMVTPRLVVAALIFTAFLGMVAGIYPAWRASRLDPVQALRSE
jgi:putative ABC transport system permease protein